MRFRIRHTISYGDSERKGVACVLLCLKDFARVWFCLKDFARVYCFAGKTLRVYGFALNGAGRCFFRTFHMFAKCFPET